MESNSVSNRMSEKQNRTAVEQESDLLIMSIIGQHNFLLPINQNYDKI